jgi:menaquinone-dependent protoporphyrinogen IX oxidase
MNSNKNQIKRKGTFKKILLIALGIISLAVVAGIVWLYPTVTCINKEYKMEEIILGEGKKTALLIYEPSKHDTSKEVSMSVAQIMADHGYTVTINLPSSELSYDWDAYDLIAFGSPIYGGTVSPVLKDYVIRNPVDNKKILIYSMGLLSADNTTEIDEMNSWVSANNDIFKTKCKTDERAVFESLIEKAITNWE